ncbi:MAG: universal stress protein [Chthoniobacteraceae bacterium]
MLSTVPVPRKETRDRPPRRRLESPTARSFAETEIARRPTIGRKRSTVADVCRGFDGDVVDRCLVTVTQAEGGPGFTFNNAAAPTPVNEGYSGNCLLILSSTTVLVASADVFVQNIFRAKRHPTALRFCPHAEEGYDSNIMKKSAKRRSSEFRRILVPVDFSDQALEALRMARMIARDDLSRLCVLHVAEPLHIDWHADMTTLQKRAHEVMRNVLEKFVRAEFGDAGPRRHFVPGKPVDVIVRFAAKMNADLIVLGTYGRTGLPRALMGSVPTFRRAASEKCGDVIDNALCEPDLQPSHGASRGGVIGDVGVIPRLR